jgi:uncharacterized delta-60 repeat protein
MLFCSFCITGVLAQTIDQTFTDPIPYRPAIINCIKVLPNNKVLLGGDISSYKTKRVNNLIRLNSDNSLDETFVFNGDNRYIIRKIEFQSSGNLIVLAYIESPFHATPEICSLFKLSPNGEIIKEFNSLFNATSFTIQNDDRILVCGGSYNFNVNYLNRLTSDLTIDSTFNNYIAFDKMLTDVNIFGDNIYVSGIFSSVNNTLKNSIVKLKLDGSIDTTFDVGIGSNGYAFSTFIQPDGKLLLGGNFLHLYNNARSFGMVRLDTNGAIDNTFSTDYYSYPNSAIMVMDSSIFIDSWIESLGGNFLLKLKHDGSLDTNFKPFRLDEFGSDYFVCGLKGNKIIFNNSTTTGSKYGLSMCDSLGNFTDSIAFEVSRYGNFKVGDYLNGKLVVSGDFIKVNDVETYGIALLGKDGSVDNSFLLPKNLGTVEQFQIFNDSTVFVSTGKSLLKLNSNGKVLMNIDFSNNKKIIQIKKFKVLKNGKIVAANDWGIYKLNEDGIEDSTFNTGSGIDITASGLDLDFQGDKIIWGSYFTIYNGKAVHRLVRLNQDASIDTSFNIGTGPDHMVTNIKVLDSGEIIVGGLFFNFNGLSVPNGIVKLSKNGEIDTQFNDNQKLNQQGQMYHDYRKIEQEESIIYIKEGNSNITSINIDGTFNSNFDMPVVSNTINDMFTIRDSVKYETILKSSSINNINKYMFALGNFKKSVNDEPSFIMKLFLGSSSISTQVNEEFNSNENYDVKLFPSPVIDKLVISFQKLLSQTNISIYSLNGIQVFSSNLKDNITEIDMSRYVPGVYLVKIQTGGNDVMIRKIIKQ